MMAQVQKVDWLECVAPVRVGGAFWSLATTKPLKRVTAEYLAGFEDYPLRKHDRISVTASLNETKAEYATLIITEVDELGKVKTLEALPWGA